jgi:glycosyltransferase involved in cell wall biosynthesis
MKLLIITQKVDRNDPVLGFFHGWITEFAKHFESLIVICLEKGSYDLPPNVKVLSLGKEAGASRRLYVRRFYEAIWKERKAYDAVFVHMNQEYVLLGGWLWRLLGKRSSMWRNHHAGNFFTDIAAFFCTKIFCTSRFSYTAKYKKTVLMPVGVDTAMFKPAAGHSRKPRSVLFLSRMAPVKRPDLLMEALHLLSKKGTSLSASFYGDPAPRDRDFFEFLKKQAKACGLADAIAFHNGIPNEKTAAVYDSHEIFINLSSSGMYDKTIFEAMACGCLVLASNENLKGQIDPRLIFEEGSVEDLASKLNVLLDMPDADKAKLSLALRDYALASHSLALLGDRLARELA